MAPEFECSREVVLPASPEEVWEAVATKAGNAAWLFPNDIKPDGSHTTAWDPPHHLAVRMEQGDWFNALEFVIEGREGGTSVLRYVHSGIFVEDWDTQYDAVQQHTDFYLHTLSEYLEHFNGRAATYIGDIPQGIQGPPTSASPDGFRRLQEALGLRAKDGEGDRVGLAPQGLEPVEGVIDYLRPNFTGIRTADALYCFFGRNAFGAPVGMSIHMFADGVDPEKTKQGWERWLETTLA
jgi:uncharacterized protein YndB with AHSA1/START domain